MSISRSVIIGFCVTVAPVLVACGGGGDGGDGGTMQPEQNQDPSASIASPVDETNADEGTTVQFEGSATDPEDGELSGDALVWESDLDGELGTGSTVSASSLSQGYHIVTLTATDSDDATATATVGVRIRPPNQEITVGLAIGDDFFEDQQGRRNADAFTRIRLGDTMEWTSGGQNPHTVTSGEGPGGTDGSGVPSGGTSMNSGNLQQGDSFAFTPDARGTWTYYCEVHPGVMFSATIEVE